MSRFNILACDIAAFIGMHPYDKMLTKFETQWQRMSPATYRAAFPDVGSISVDSIAGAADIITEARRCGAAAANTEALDEAKNQLAEKVQQLRCDNGTLVRVQTEVVKALNMSYGTDHSEGLRLYTEHTGLAVDRPAGNSSCTISTDADLTGRACGFVGMHTVAMVKNRTRYGAVQSTTQDHERIQAQAYMHLYNRKRTVLIQYLNGHIFTAFIPRDNAYWEDTVMPRIDKIISEIHRLVRDPEAAAGYAAMRPCDREQHLRDLVDA